MGGSGRDYSQWGESDGGPDGMYDQRADIG
jgi:hypothetical protein